MGKVLITGATGGIGLALAQQFLEEGYDVGFTSRSAEKAAETQKELRKIGNGKVFSFVQDLTNYESAQKIAQFAQEKLAGFDILINNVGVWTETPFLKVTPSEFRSHIANLEGTFFLTQAIAQYWIDNKIEGTIVNLGSLWGKVAVGPTPSSAHSVVKAAIHQMTKNVAQELGSHQIRVNAVSPGVVNDEATHLTHIHPLGKLGRPEDVAKIVRFLASKEMSPWMTGAIIDVDGGASCCIPQAPKIQSRL